MGIYSTRRATNLASSLAVGGLLCFGIFSFLLAATIVLSLIPVYTPDHSDEGFGDRKYKYITLEFLFKKKLFSFPFSSCSIYNLRTFLSTFY